MMGPVHGGEGVRGRDGMSLVEVIISLFLLASLSLFLITSLTNAKYMSEDNFYETTALAVVLSAMQQMMEVSTDDLNESAFTMVVGTRFDENGVILGNDEVELQWNNRTEVFVPVVTREAGASTKTMPLDITPRRIAATDTDGWWLEIEYSYIHPGNGKKRTRAVRNMRSTVR